MLNDKINFISLKPIVRGKSINLREVELSDAEFILSLRINPDKNKYLSFTENNLNRQKDFINSYKKSIQDYYFIICLSSGLPIGTMRIYDIKNESFCWGSWILSDEAYAHSALESALLMYDFAFYSLHYKYSHFDVRKENLNVIKNLDEPEFDLETILTLGTFLERRIDEYQELFKNESRNLQTITYFGINPENLVASIEEIGFLGVDRIVPFGAAFDMTPTWDGIDTIRSLSRVIEIR